MSAPNLPHGKITQQVVVSVYADNALSVQGPMDDPAWMIAALENAIDAVRNQSRPGSQLVVPGKDVSLIRP